jgi:hypothetical protein
MGDDNIVVHHKINIYNTWFIASAAIFHHRLRFRFNFLKASPMNFIFVLGKKKKSHGAKSGEYGEWGKTAVLFLANFFLIFNISYFNII